MTGALADVSIVVAPRERPGAVLDSLESLFSTIPDEVAVVVVEGASPPPVRERLQALRERRPFTLISTDCMLIPNAARNRGARETTSRHLVFADNDMHYEPGWLEALMANAGRERADAVAPLICIGPPAVTTIHHAGGTLALECPGGRPALVEHHRLMNRPLRALTAQTAPVQNEVCEFHCCLVSRDLFDRMGGLDERLITREQMDFALRCKALGARVTFAADSVVTYMALAPFDPADLPYHMFRWADALAVRSMDAFEQSWGIALDRQRIRYRWIARHRSRAAASVHPRSRRLLGRILFDRLITRRLEAAVQPHVQAALATMERFRPAPCAVPARDLVGSMASAVP